jgi:proteasome lid subunit RPN8/RPN11
VSWLECQEAAAIHARADAPREACGFIVEIDGQPTYIACRNDAKPTDEFELPAEDYAAAEDLGRIIAVVHSHPAGPREATPADLAACRETGLPWFILIDIEAGVWVVINP